MQRFLCNGLRCFFCEKQSNAFIFKEFLVLLEDRVARLGENLDQRDFIELIENADDREASDKFGDETEFDQILWLSLAEKLGIALRANGPSLLSLILLLLRKRLEAKSLLPDAAPDDALDRKSTRLTPVTV